MTWPSPEVPARVAEASEIPRGAATVAKVATDAGWTVTPTYARGVPSDRVERVVDSIALRMSRGRQRAWAVWEDRKFHSGYAWSADAPITRHNVGTLRTALEDSMGFDWDSITTGSGRIPRDQDGRPMVAPPGSNRLVAYTRCTSFAGSIDDNYNLSRWQQRMVALGLAERPDLMVSVAAHHDEKDELNKVCETAIEAAKGKAAAGVGTALHRLTEKLDRGEPLGPVPVEYQADLAAFAEATKPLKVLGIEQFVVNDELQIGGTFDRLYEYEGRRYIGDTKSGGIDEYRAGKIAMQLAIYANSVLYEPDGSVREFLDVDLNRAIVVHLPAGQGRCELRWVDIRAGWEAVELACRVKDWRSRRDLYQPFDEEAAALDLLERELGAEPVSLVDQIAAAVDGPALEAIWSANRGDWTDALTAAAKKRKAELHRRSLKNFVAPRAEAAAVAMQ